VRNRLSDAPKRGKEAPLLSEKGDHACSYYGWGFGRYCRELTCGRRRRRRWGEGGYWRSTIQYHSGIGFYGKKLRKYQEE